MEWVFFEKFETAGTKAGEVKEIVAEEIHYDKKWDEDKNVGKFKHWRGDTHTVHRHSNSAYSHYTEAHRKKIADAPRWPAQEGVCVCVCVCVYIHTYIHTN